MCFPLCAIGLASIDANMSGCEIANPCSFGVSNVLVVDMRSLLD